MQLFKSSMLKDRLKNLIDAKAKSVYEFSRKIGKSQGNINDILKGTVENPRTDLFDKISDAYPDIDTEWLRTGKGSMYLDKEPKDAIEILANKHGCTVEEYELVMKLLDEEKDLALYAAKAVILKDQKARERFIKLTE